MKKRFMTTKYNYKMNHTGFTCYISLHNNILNIKIIHDDSKRTWNRELHSLPWGGGKNLTAEQVKTAIQNKALLLPNNPPQPNKNLLLQLDIDFLGKKHHIPFELQEQHITDIQRLEMMIIELKTEIKTLNKNLNTTNKGLNKITKTLEGGELFFDDIKSLKKGLNLTNIHIQNIKKTLDDGTLFFDEIKNCSNEDSDDNDDSPFNMTFEL